MVKRTSKKRTTKKRTRKSKPKASKDRQPVGLKVETVTDPPAVEHDLIEQFVIPIDQIILGRNDRDDKREKHAIEALAESMRRNGQLQPVRVAPWSKGEDGETDSYRLIFGHRRLLAAEQIGLTTIRAEIVDEARSDIQIDADRAAENLDRLDLNPIEESVAVARMIDLAREEIARNTAPPDDQFAQDMAIERVAAALGRSQTWVRDRAYLARLSGKARKLVLDDRLPLRHAREIAKLADPAMRNQIAGWAARDENGEGGLDFERVRELVQRNIWSLKSVTWDLGVAFAGKPACDQCPSNTANDKDLFEHDTKPPEDGLCLNQRCHKAKTDACNKAIDSALGRIEKANTSQPEGERLTGSKADIGDRCPKGVKMSRWLASGRRRLGSPSKTGKPATSDDDGPLPASEQKQAASTAKRADEIRQMYRRAESKWLGDERDAWVKAINERPGALPWLLVICEWGPLTRWGPRRGPLPESESKMVLKAFEGLLAVDAGESSEYLRLIDLCVSTQHFDAERIVDPLEGYEDFSRALLRVMGYELRPMPSREEIEAEYDREHSQEPAKKPVRKKRTRKKGKTSGNAAAAS